MAREGSDFSESEATYPTAVDGSPSRALVAPTIPSNLPATMPGYAPRGPEILSGGFNQAWLTNCLRRRWLMAILMGMLVGASVAGLLLWAFPETSQVTAYLKVRSKTDTGVFDNANERLMPADIERQAMNHLALLKSPLVLEAALSQQNIIELDAVRAHKGEEMLWLLDALRVSFPGDGEILEVRYEGDEDPAQMVSVIDAVVKSYQTKVLFEESVQAASTQNDIRKVLEDTTGRLEKKLKDLQTKQEGSGSLRQDVEIPQLSNEIKSLETQISKAKEDRVNLEVFKELADTASKNPSLIDAAIAAELDSDPTINLYKQRIFELNSELQAKLSASKNANSAEIRRIRATIQQTEGQMAQQRSDAERAMRDKISKMPNESYRSALVEYRVRDKSLTELLAKHQAALEAAKLKLRSLSVRDPAEVILENQIESEKEIASNLQTKVLEWRVMNDAQARQENASGAGYAKVTVIQNATALPATNKLERISIAGIGGLAAMALTCYGIALLDFRHRRLNGASDIDEGLGIRVLGVLPATSLKALTGNSLVATQVAEAIDNVRATLMHDSSAGGRQVIMVTSSGSMEGNTVVASSLALSLARAGRRTLLVDGDLRSPSLHKLFGMPIEEGLSEVLRSEIDLADAVKPTNNNGLYLLTAGVSNAEAIHALATEQPQAIFEKLRDQFDFIVIDAPPVIGISDSLSLGQYIDGAILTVLRDHSEIRQIYKAVEMLKGMGVRVIGSVVNGVPTKSDRRVVRLHNSGGSNAPRLTKVDG